MLILNPAGPFPTHPPPAGRYLQCYEVKSSELRDSEGYKTCVDREVYGRQPGGGSSSAGPVGAFAAFQNMDVEGYDIPANGKSYTEVRRRGCLRGTHLTPSTSLTGWLCPGVTPPPPAPAHIATTDLQPWPRWCQAGMHSQLGLLRLHLERCAVHHGCARCMVACHQLSRRPVLSLQPWGGTNPEAHHKLHLPTTPSHISTYCNPGPKNRSVRLPEDECAGQQVPGWVERVRQGNQQAAAHRLGDVV